MTRTIKEVTVKRFCDDTQHQQRAHLTDFLAACDFAYRRKTLNGLTPYEYISKIWTSEPDRAVLCPIQQMPGLNTRGCLDAAARYGFHVRKLPISRSPVAWLFSGWNWVPTTVSRPMTAVTAPA